jgi:hypothetical protein
MKRSTLVVLVFALMFVVIFTGQIFAEDKDKDKDKNVVVTNTPLPVTGTVDVGNTPTVNVGNSPMVGIVGPVQVTETNPMSMPDPMNVNVESMPPMDLSLGSVVKVENSSGALSVNVANTPLPVTISNGNVPTYRRVPVAAIMSGSPPNGYSVTYGPVDTGYLLVIEQISMSIWVSTQSNSMCYDLTMWTAVGGNFPVFHFIPVKVSEDEMWRIYTTCENVRIYADEGTTVHFNTYTTGGFHVFSVSFCGYLIPSDSPSLAP